MYVSAPSRDRDVETETTYLCSWCTVAWIRPSNAIAMRWCDVGLFGFVPCISNNLICLLYFGYDKRGCVLILNCDNSHKFLLLWRLKITEGRFRLGGKRVIGCVVFLHEVTPLMFYWTCCDAPGCLLALSLGQYWMVSASRRSAISHYRADNY